MMTLDEFRRHLNDAGRSRNTIDAYASDVRKYLSSLDHPPASDLEFCDTAREYVTELRRNQAPASSVLRYMSALRAFAKYNQWGDPFTDYRSPRVPWAQAHPLPNMMQDVDRLIAHANRPHHRVLIALCGYAGLRVSEARSITPRSLFKDAGGLWWLAVHGKGGSYREVPVADELLTVLSYFSPAPDEPFCDLSDRQARRAISDVGKRLGMDVASHDLRMTFATTIYSKTKDIRTTQELLGHASSTTTERYTLVDEATKRAAITTALTKGAAA